MQLALMFAAALLIAVTVVAVVLAVASARADAVTGHALQHLADTRDVEEAPSAVARLLDSTRLGALLRQNHEAANSKYTYNKFLSLTMGLAAATAVAVTAWLRDPIGGLILGAVMLVVPPLGDFLTAGKLSQEFDAMMPGALETMVAALRAGASLPQAIDTVAVDLGGRVGVLFGSMSRDFQMGMSLEEAVTRARKRTKSAEFATLCIVLSALRRTGGDVAKVLERLAETSKSRQRARTEIQTTLQESKYSSAILLLLPAAGMLMMYVQDTSYFSPLFQSRYGLPVLIGGLALWIIGFVSVRLLTRVEVN